MKIAHESGTAPASSSGVGVEFEPKVTPVGTYYTVFLILMVLLVVTVAAAYADLGILSVPVALMIASVKAGFVVWFFMHVNHGSRMVQLFSLAGFAWLVILFTFTLADYVTRT